MRTTRAPPPPVAATPPAGQGRGAATSAHATQTTLKEGGMRLGARNYIIILYQAGNTSSRVRSTWATGSRWIGDRSRALMRAM